MFVMSIALEAIPRTDHIRRVSFNEGRSRRAVVAPF